MAKYENLFSPITIGGVRVKNRIAMPAMSTNFANLDGTPSRKNHAFYAERAKGGCGLIFTEAVDIDFPNNLQNNRTMAMNSNTHIQEWHELVETVHSFGTKIVVQLYHPGLLAKPELNGGMQSVAPSEIMGAREMTHEEIVAVRDSFINNAKIAAAVGFDGIELHAAHMYLLNEFLSPISNHRTDEYGGSIENRFRLLGEIIQGIREACPKPFILAVRLATIDLFPGGIEAEEGAIFAKMCEDAGADMLNASCGFYTKPQQGCETQFEPQGNRLYMSDIAKKAVSIPVSAVGKLYEPAFCDGLIAENRVDVVCIGRPQICDPAWANKARLGKDDEIRKCMHCLEGCLAQHFTENSVRCAVNPYVGFEDMYTESNVPATNEKKKIAVVGGGPAGMQFAITATRRGHEVEIFEASDRLGGHMILAGMPPKKDSVLRALDWFRGEVERRVIPVTFNKKVSAEELSAAGYDAVVVATGARSSVPPIKGIETATEACEALGTGMKFSGKVVIIGGGQIGCDVAHKAVDEGADVTIIEALDGIGRGYDVFTKGILTEYLQDKITLHLNSMVKEVAQDSVTFTDQDGNTQRIAADKVIFCTGQRPTGDDLSQELTDIGVESYLIGNSSALGRIRNATKAGLDLAYRV